jgi:hypothetical protein
LNDFNIWLSSFLACCLVKDYFLFLVGAVNLGGSVPQAKSFFAVRKITGTKKISSYWFGGWLYHPAPHLLG